MCVSHVFNALNILRAYIHIVSDTVRDTVQFAHAILHSFSYIFEHCRFTLNSKFSPHGGKTKWPATASPFQYLCIARTSSGPMKKLCTRLSLFIRQVFEDDRFKMFKKLSKNVQKIVEKCHKYCVS